MVDSLVPIGELARRAGVPVKTLRFYSDIGVVPPATRTASGYRMYGEDERLRLETVKTLRGLGFSLDEISATLEHRSDLRTTIEVQLRAIAMRMRELQRVAVVLRAALERADEPTSAHLARLETLARLSAAERTALLDEFLGDVRGDAVPEAWAEWWAGIRDASLPDLPANPTPEQLEAWLELAELLADAGFRARWREMATEAHTTAGPGAVPDMPPLLEEAQRAEAAGVRPQDTAADDLVQRFLAAHEPVVGAGPDLARRTLEHISRYDDPRTRRYWQLVARIRGWPEHWPQQQAMDWFIAALRSRVPAAHGHGLQPTRHRHASTS